MLVTAADCTVVYDRATIVPVYRAEMPPDVRYGVRLALSSIYSCDIVVSKDNILYLMAVCDCFDLG